MRIVFASSEVFPFIKSGGLADVSMALPKALSKLGHNISIIMPKYGNISNDTFKLKEIVRNLQVPVFDEKATIYKTSLLDTEITVYMIENEFYFNRDEIYDDYDDNLERFSFFSISVLELLKYLDHSTDVIHCNDWQTAMIPAYLKILYNNDPFFKKTKTLFTIHNLGYQGIFDGSKFAKLGLEPKYFHYKYLEFYGKVNLLKAGIVFADKISTVSERYAKEIQTPEYGFGLDGVIKERSKDLYGILNGIDYDVWNPKKDPYIWKNYDINTIDNKYVNKSELQKINNLPVKDVPLIAMISRMVPQKGFDLVIEILDVLFEFEVQLIILGTGLKKYEDFFREYGAKQPEKLGVHIDFNKKKSHQLEAGADIFLMPSRYEPCGLNQMISLRYGTIPLVHETGGLADSVKDISKYEDGNGFVFSSYSPIELLKTIIRAIKTYKNKELWKKIMINGMKMDFSFDKSARKYEKLYYEMILA